MLELSAVPGLPEIRPGDDLATLIAAAAEFEPGDVLAIAHKVVSKAEGRIVAVADVVPGDRALALAAAHGKASSAPTRASTPPTPPTRTR